MWSWFLRLTRDSISGLKVESFKRKSFSTHSLFLYLFFKYTKVENALSHKYVVVNPISSFKAMVEITGYSPLAFIQNGIKLESLNVDFRAKSQESSVRESSSDVESFTLLRESSSNGFLIQSSSSCIFGKYFLKQEPFLSIKVKIY